jgi:hypothetical protein
MPVGFVLCDLTIEPKQAWNCDKTGHFIKKTCWWPSNHMLTCTIKANARDGTAKRNENNQVTCWSTRLVLIKVLFAWLISHQPAVLFSQNKSATCNQPAVLFSQNKPAPAINHQPNEQSRALFFIDNAALLCRANRSGFVVDNVHTRKMKRASLYIFLSQSNI